MNEIEVSREIAGRRLSFRTGWVAKQASAAVLVQMGETVVLATVVRDKPREGIDFFPLTVDYRERTAAAGKFPGGFYKREGRPTNKEILTMRMIDRPLRPAFPKGFKDEIQIQCMVLAADLEHEPDVLAMNGASAAVTISNAPCDGPQASVRVARVDGEFVLFPTHAQMEYSELDLLLSGYRDGINMIEVGAHELPEDVVLGAIEFGHEGVRAICDMIGELRSKAGREKVWEQPASADNLVNAVRDRYAAALREKRLIAGKLERQEAIKQLYDEAIEAFSPAEAKEPEYSPDQVKEVLHELEEKIVRELILKEKQRSDGRGLSDIRELTCQVGVLPRVHGSSLFTRGETQALVTTTLGTPRDEQIVDGLTEEYSKKFMLHYSFPPFCVGEARRIMGPGRREIGHGALAERALEAVLPLPENFPYTIRLNSDIMESNGSSSMASVCGGTLALMDAGVPITQPVAGISIGMVQEGSEYVLFTDIIGEEDHFGDMDFKVAGSGRGITAIQLDLKTRCLTHEIIRETIAAAKDARKQILRKMLEAIPRPRRSISEFAPRILITKIAVDKIGKLIGPGGKGVKQIEADTGARVEIEDDGTVVVSSLSAAGAEAAMAMVQAVTEEAKVGAIYNGRVTSIKDFGAFIEIVPGTEGLCHVSELADGFVKSPTDVVNIGDRVRVKVILIDDQGRVKLSRKAVLREEREQAAEPQPTGSR